MSEEKSIQNQGAPNDVGKEPIANSTPVPVKTDNQDQSDQVEQSTNLKEAMEVHHHPHLHHKKKWTDYLFEFFMIFLAVILGFLFENLREHYVEHQRAKEYAQSLYNDLKKDAEQINSFLDLRVWRGKKLDSLIMVMKLTERQKGVTDFYYYSCFLLLPDLSFRPSDNTILQLRNSGTLRYFSIRLYNLITEYYNNCNFFTERENEFKQTIPPFSLTSKIFDAGLLSSLYSSTFQPDIKYAIHLPDRSKEFKLLSFDKQALNEYQLYVDKQKRYNDALSFLLHMLVEKVHNQLIQELQKEYPLH